MVQLMERVRPAKVWIAASTLDNLGLVLNDQRRLDEAEAVIREALAIQRKVFGEEHPDVSDSLFNLGAVLQGRGKLLEAEAAFRDSLAMRRKLMGNDHSVAEVTLRYLAGLYQEEGKLAEAEAACREQLALAKKLSGTGKPDLAYSLQRLTDLLYDQAKWAGAEAPCRDAIAEFKRVMQEDPGNSDLPLGLGHSEWKLAEVQGKIGRSDSAEQVLREALEVFEKAARDFPTEPYLRQE